jgi:integrase
MPRPRLPYLQRHTTRHGKVAWYVRRGRGPLLRIRAAHGTPEFEREYLGALRGEHSRPGKAPAGTFEWLVDLYRQSGAWRSLSPATRRQRENILRPLVASAGRDPLSMSTRTAIIAGRERRAATPFQAKHFVNTMRGLFKWAVEAGNMKRNPAADVSYLPARTRGHPTWSEDDVAAYERRWPLGTREHMWLAVLLFTGLRRGDAARLGPEHVRDGVATIGTEKSGGRVTVTIPLLPPLLEALAAGPIGQTYITSSKGEPFTKESFGNAFREACDKAGVRKSAHGVRKIGAVRAAMNGATVSQLEAIFGWTGGRMATLYTREADRVRLAREAVEMLLPTRKVRLSPEETTDKSTS